MRLGTSLRAVRFAGWAEPRKGEHGGCSGTPSLAVRQDAAFLSPNLTGNPNFDEIVPYAVKDSLIKSAKLRENRY